MQQNTKPSHYNLEHHFLFILCCYSISVFFFLYWLSTLTNYGSNHTLLLTLLRLIIRCIISTGMFSFISSLVMCSVEEREGDSSITRAEVTEGVPGWQSSMDEVRPENLYSLDAVGLSASAASHGRWGQWPLEQTGVAFPLFKTGDRRMCSHSSASLGKERIWPKVDRIPDQLCVV